MPVELVTVADVEIIQAGTWDASTGKVTWEIDDLYAAVEAQDDPALRKPIIKLGHVDPRFDGQPTVGRIENLRVVGASLRGDLVGVPAWLAEIMPVAFPSRSVEGYFDLTTPSGSEHRFALTAVALLGVTPPAIESLDDVKALYEVAAGLGAGATGTPVTATFKEPPVPQPVAASVSMEQVRTAFYEQLSDRCYAWVREMWTDFLIAENEDGELFRIPFSGDSADAITFGEPEEVVVQYVTAPPDAEDADEATEIVLMTRFRPSDGRAVAAARFTAPTGRLSGPRHTVSASGPQGRPTNGGTMPLTNEQLTALGLAEDATPEQITEALVAAGEYAAAERDALRAQLSQTGTEETTDLPDGVVAIDATALEELRVAASRGVSAHDTLRRQERDGFLGAAVQAGKFAPARLAHFQALYDADEEGTKSLIAKLAAGTVPTSEIGHAHGGTTDDDDAFFQKIAPGFVELERAAQQ